MDRKKVWALGLGIFAVLFSGAMITLNVVLRQMREKKDKQLAEKIDGIKTNLRKEE